MTRPTREWLEKCAAGHTTCTEDELCEVQPLLAEIEALRDLADMNEYAAEYLDAKEDVARLEADNERLLCAETDLTAEVERLTRDNKALQESVEDLCNQLAKERAEIERLKAENAKLRIGAAEVQADSIHRYSAPLGDWPENPDGPTAQLRELREAAEAYRELTRRAFEQDEDESCNSATTAERDRAHAIYQRFVDVLAKVKP